MRASSQHALEVGWDHTYEPTHTTTLATNDRPASLRAEILAVLADPRVSAVTARALATTLDRALQDVELTLDTMLQGDELVHDPQRDAFCLRENDKAELEAMFRATAWEAGEAHMLEPVRSYGGLAAMDDDIDEPRLPVTAGLLSLFLPGTGQLLNGDVGRASLVFAVWSLAWITHLSPVWTFVCLYAGAEAFFTAKIRGMERKLQKTPPMLGKPSETT